jgi:xylulokinase
MSHRTVIAIDLGTQSMRVCALRLNGERLWNWSSPIDSHIDGEVFEQSPSQWQATLLQGLDAAAQAGLQPHALLASGPLAGYVPLDAQGQALANASMYSDRRSAEDAPRMLQRMHSTPPLRVIASDPLPHWLRLQREFPEIAQRTASFLDATGWLNFFLSGQSTLNEYTAMRLYTPALRQAAGVDGAPFGRPVATGETLGRLRPALAQRWDWGEIPILSAPFDSKCAYIGSGIEMPGDATDISGTVTSFGVISNTPVSDPLQRIYSVPLGSRWLVRGSTACAGSALEWARQQWFAQSFDALDAAAASVPPGANGLTFLPYLAGERAPLWNPHARGALLGMSLGNTSADMVRAVYEGLALSLLHIADTMRECGVEIRTVRMAGGLARNPLLCQIKADVLGVPVVQLSDHELTTAGLGVIAATALGAYASHGQASPHFTSTAQRFDPQPQAQQAYAQPISRYMAYARALAPLFTPPA